MKKRIILVTIIVLILIVAGIGIKGFLYKNKEKNSILNKSLFLKAQVLTLNKNGKEIPIGNRREPKEPVYYGNNKIYYCEKKDGTSNNGFGYIVSYFDINEQKETEIMDIYSYSINGVEVPYIDDKYVFTYEFSTSDGTYTQILKRRNLETKNEETVLEEVSTEILENNPSIFITSPTIIRDNDTYYISMDKMKNDEKIIEIYKVVVNSDPELLTTYHNSWSYKTYMYLNDNKLYYSAFNDKDDVYCKLYSFDLKTKKTKEEISNIGIVSPVSILNNTIAVINDNFEEGTYTLFLKVNNKLHKIDLRSNLSGDYDYGTDFYVPSIKILSDNTIILNLNTSHYYRININDLIKNDVYILKRGDLISRDKYNELLLIPLNYIYNKTKEKGSFNIENKPGLYLKSTDMYEQSPSLYYLNNEGKELLINQNSNFYYYDNNKLYTVTLNYEDNAYNLITFDNKTKIKKEEKLADKDTLCSEKCYLEFLYIDENYLYYHTFGNNEAYRINLNNKKIEVFANDVDINFSFLAEIDNNLYFVSELDSMNLKKIYKITPDLKQEIVYTFDENAEYKKMENNKLYFTSNNKLYSFDLLSKQLKEEISDIGSYTLMDMKDDIIILYNTDSITLKYENEIYKIKLDNVNYLDATILSDKEILMETSGRLETIYKVNIKDLISKNTYKLKDKDMILAEEYNELYSSLYSL